MVPLLPLPILNSESKNVVSNQPLSLLFLNTAIMAKTHPRSKTNPLLNVMEASLNDTRARFGTLGDSRNVPPARPTPKSSSTSLYTQDFSISKTCFTTRFDVSTVNPAAETVPLLLTRLVSMLASPSDGFCGFQVFCRKDEDVALLAKEPVASELSHHGMW